MPEIQNHPPSTFCWLELATTDQASAKRFYSELFGWGTEEMPLGEGMTYTFLRLRGKEVAALFTMNAEQRKQGAPPRWQSYVAVENADQVVSQARALGAKVMVEPFDVMDVGRMAVLEDPSGAAVSLWQPRKHKGAAIIDEPGSACWYELSTRDTGAATRFYTQLFGWKATAMPMGDGQYTVFSRGAKNVAGLMEMPPSAGNAPPNWMSYFAAADSDQTVAKARAMGGQVLVPPTDIPGTGRFAVIQDPQGAVFGILTALPMP